MQKREINRQILAIASPAIIANITTPLLGLVDVAITGHLGSPVYIGAIAVGATMFNMIYWLFGFLRMGTAGLTSQSYGSGDAAAASAHLRRSLLIAMGISVALIALAAPLGDLALNFIDADTAAAPYAREYFKILIWGAPAVLGLYALNGWQLGMQNSKMPMFVAIFINVVNIGISATAVYIFNMKIEGVALGTLSAQWLGFLLALTLTFKKYRPQSVKWRVLTQASELKRLFKLNGDIFIRTLCLVAVTVWFTRAGALQGIEILDANALLMQFFMFFSYFTDGFAFAGEALAGKHYGAGDKVTLTQVISALMRWGAAIAAAFAIVYFIGGDWILDILTSEETVKATAREYLPWAITVPLCGFTAFIHDGISVGLTESRRMLASVAAGMITFFVIYFLLRGPAGNHGLWAAFAGYLLTRSAIIYHR